MKFSKNGKYLASAGQDAAVRVWEVCLNRGEARAESESEQSVSEAGAYTVDHTSLRSRIHCSLHCLCWDPASCTISHIFHSQSTGSPALGVPRYAPVAIGASGSLRWGLSTYPAGNRAPDIPSVLTGKASEATRGIPMHVHSRTRGLRHLRKGFPWGRL